MSANDSHHETPFDRWAYRALCGIGIALAAGIASGIVYGYWSWLLNAPCVR